MMLLMSHSPLRAVLYVLALSPLWGCPRAAIKLGDTAVPDDSEPSGDLDGDGYISAEAGGDDCDDADAAVHPGASDTWYDGVDQNCDEASDYDQDGDGHDSISAGGDDCADTDPAVLVGAEGDNGLDDDCDGAIDEDFVDPNDVLITEVMTHPLARSERDAEWFEVQNASARDIDLVGWTIVSGAESAVIASSVKIASGARVVLAANASAEANGDVGAAYGYDGNIIHLDDEDDLGLQVNGTTVFDVSWDSSWPIAQGTSMALDPDHHSPSEARSAIWWCNSSSTLPDGDLGTPNAANDQCTTVDEDGDGYTEAEGDCNDVSPLVHPGAGDVWDNLDNDCDGSVDNGVVDDVASGVFTGAANTYLGSTGIGAGDFDADGQDDLVVGSASAGYVYVIGGSDAAAGDGPATGYDIASVNVGYYYGGGVGQGMGDQTGDGSADLVVGVYDYSVTATKAYIFEGGGAHVGTLDSGDTWGTLTGGAVSYGGTVAFTTQDFDGDGIDDIVQTEPLSSTSPSAYYRGVVYVVSGADADTAFDLDDSPGILEGEVYGDYFGAGVGGGDLDGDGSPELFLGAPDHDGNGTNSGAWYVFEDPFQEGSGEDEANWIIRGSNDGDEAGYGQALALDLDDSGHNDLALGCFAGDAAYVFLDPGTPTGEDVASGADVELSGDGNSFGFALSGGDFDADGQMDLAVGAPSVGASATPLAWYSYTGSPSDSVYFFDGTLFGRGNLDAADATASLHTSGTWTGLGGRLSGAGDFGGDGIDDLAIVAPRTTSAQGTAYVVEGR
ncbi:MAG: hypothetical protein EXR71_19865 [Myxococcales bacterium]|nr:hypothetical protein [Myxococcales bacterium]